VRCLRTAEGTEDCNTETAEGAEGGEDCKMNVKGNAEGGETRRTRPMDVNYISGEVVDAAMKVHSVLGPGLLESAYQACLAHELRKRGFSVACQVPLPVLYEGVEIDVGYRIDMVVEDAVLVELKAASKTLEIHEVQALSNLKLSVYRVGLLINFHVVHLKDGIKRFVNGL
jgi:GxxExxY protein